MVAVSLSEPAIVHDEALDSHPCCFFGQCFLPSFIDFESCCIPGVVKYRAGSRPRTAGKNLRALEGVQNSRCFANPTIGVASVERRCRFGFPGSQTIPKVEGIKPPGNTHLLLCSLLHADPPAPAPPECPKPNRTILAVAVAIPVQRKPRIGLYTGAAAPAFQYLHARVQRLLGELPLTRPAPRQIAQPIAIPLRKI